MKKKVLSLLLAVVMTFSLAVTANAAEETAQDLDGDIVILHTNDVHGAISGYAKVAALKDAYEARGAYVLLMDAGDSIQGDPTVSTSEGATAVELMNLAGYDVASMGNHEFDYGYQNLKDLEADADFTIVDANVLYNGQVAFEDNVVFTAPDGTKIGVFGLDTPETATKAHPAKIQGVTFLAGDKMFDWTHWRQRAASTSSAWATWASMPSPPATAPSTCWRRWTASTCSSTATLTPPRRTSWRHWAVP